MPVEQVTTEYDVFVSYARKETGWVKDHIYRPLLGCRRRDGRPPRVFFDIEGGIAPGDPNWQRAIERALQSSRLIVTACSRVYFEQPNCDNEFRMALTLEKDKPGTLFPILTDNMPSRDLPLGFRTVNFVPTDERMPDWFQRLCDRADLTPSHERLVLRFLDRPADAAVNHTLAPVRVAIEAESGSVPGEHVVSLRAEAGDLHGQLSLKTENGVARFDDLSISAPVNATRLVAEADGCEPVSSVTFKVEAPPVPAPGPEPGPRLEEEVLASVPLPGRVLFFGDGTGFAVLSEERLHVYGMNGEELGETSVSGRVRLVRRSADQLAVATWSGNIVLANSKGGIWSWSLQHVKDGMNIVGGLALSEEELYVGFWSGVVIRLAPGAEPAKLTDADEEGGVQAMGVLNHQLYVCTLDGRLYLPGQASRETARLEKRLHWVQDFPGCAVIVGDTKLYFLRQDHPEPLEQQLPLTGVLAVCGDVQHPVVVDTAGKGVRFDAGLVYRSRFHVAPGAQPTSADNAGHYCVFATPDGDRGFMVDGRLVFTHSGGDLAVAPSGKVFAECDGHRTCLVDGQVFLKRVEETNRERHPDRPE